MKRIAFYILITLSTLSAILILWQLRSIILLFVLSLAIAAALHGPIRTMTRRRIPRSLAMGMIYGATLVGLGGFVILLSIPIAVEIETMVEQSVAQYDTFRQSTEVTAESSSFRSSGWRSTFFEYLPNMQTVEDFLVDREPSTLFWQVLGITTNLMSLAAQALVAIALSVYWTADQMHFERLWLSLLPPRRRTNTRQLWRTLEGNIGAYIRSEIAQSLVAGALLTLIFYLIGASYPYSMALLAAVSWLIPLVGGGIGLLLVVAIALLDGIWVAGGAALGTIIIFSVMEFYVEPKLYHHNRYSAIIVILMMLTMLYALGIIGLLVAPPLALIVQILLDELFLPSATRRQKQRKIQEEWTELQEKIQELQHKLATETEPSPRVQSLTSRLNKLAAAVEPALKK